jgi:hypothetical protein
MPENGHCEDTKHLGKCNFMYTVFQRYLYVFILRACGPIAPHYIYRCLSMWASAKHLPKLVILPGNHFWYTVVMVGGPI